MYQGDRYKKIFKKKLDKTVLLVYTICVIRERRGNMIKTVEGKNQIERLARVRSRIKRLQGVEEELELEMKTHIKMYGSLKNGLWTAVINIVTTIRPKWKEEFILRIGQPAAEEVVQNTKPAKCEKLEIYKEGIKVA